VVGVGVACVAAVAAGVGEVRADEVFDDDALPDLFALTCEPSVSFGATFAPVASTAPGSAFGAIRAGLVLKPGVPPPIVRGAHAGEPTIEPVKIRLTQFLSENM
jgi:hypothetical protein